MAASKTSPPITQIKGAEQPVFNSARNPAPPPVTWGREALLNAASSCVLQDRNASYGNPEDNFADIARFWNVYLEQRGMITHITPQDIAHLMILMKIARLAKNMPHTDSLIDIAGYAACAAECQGRSIDA